MKPWLLPVMLLALTYQVVALPLYRFGGVAPDFVLIVVVYAAIYETRWRALALAAFSGLVVDALSLEPWGAHALGYTVAALLLLVARRASGGDDLPLRLLLIGSASLVVYGLKLAIVWEPGTTGLDTEFFVAALASIYNAALGGIIFGLLAPLRSRLVTSAYRRLW